MLPWVVAATVTIAVVSLGLPKAYAIVAGTVAGLVMSLILHRASGVVA